MEHERLVNSEIDYSEHTIRSNGNFALKQVIEDPLKVPEIGGKDDPLAIKPYTFNDGEPLRIAS